MKLSEEIKARVSPEIKSNLAQMASRNEMEVSDLIRRALAEFVHHHSNKILWAKPKLRGRAEV
jgi:predicted transcriptional regulator